ncbi:hypothetical protein N752_06940 [Desulforamulus aquiferis]|nr:methyltransferase domain-containing protein [Desulforamulus aquiferis]RYD05975.1 hypothetical protein N752_06940 [Desulforamulus aquiferis]
MTDEMLAEARNNQARSGLTNVEFIKGHIEEIPLEDNSVDVIISNCVINLSGDKDEVLKEAYRVIKPGGRFAVSDIVLMKPLPEKVQKSLIAWTGCISGALTVEEYREKLAAAGFTSIEVQLTRVYNFSETDAANIMPELAKEELEKVNGNVGSAFIRLIKRSHHKFYCKKVTAYGEMTFLLTYIFYGLPVLIISANSLGKPNCSISMAVCSKS